jgi:hypothetical protein
MNEEDLAQGAVAPKTKKQIKTYAKWEIFGFPGDDRCLHTTEFSHIRVC